MMDAQHKRELVDELKLVAGMMRQEQDPPRKNYMFSAAYGITSRILRLDYSKELLMADFVITNAYNMIQARVQSIMQGDRLVPIEMPMFDELANLVEKLGARIDADEDYHDVLDSILELAFTTTGPGHYMRASGKLRLSIDNQPTPNQ
jgi:hypothetical protein